MLFYSQLVPTLVWVLPQPSSEHPERSGERSGSSWQGAAATLGGLWHHFTGNSNKQLRTTGAAGWTGGQTEIHLSTCAHSLLFLSVPVPAVRVAPAGDLVLRGVDSWWVASALWQHLLQPSIIPHHGLRGLHHLLPWAAVALLPETRLWGNIAALFFSAPLLWEETVPPPVSSQLSRFLLLSIFFIIVTTWIWEPW